MVQGILRGVLTDHGGYRAVRETNVDSNIKFKWNLNNRLTSDLLKGLSLKGLSFGILGFLVQETPSGLEVFDCH